MGVYLCAKFEVSSTILSFRQGDNFIPPPQNEPFKSPPRLGLRCLLNFGVPQSLPHGQNCCLS